MGSCTYDDSFLFSHSLFGGLSCEEIDYIRDCFKEEVYEGGQLILTQGEPNNRIFFILEGGVEILKHPVDLGDADRLISTLIAGDTFGEMELIDIQPCAASARAVGSTTVLTFTNYDLYRLSKTHLKVYAMIIMNLAREISRRLRKTDQDLAEIMYETQKQITSFD